MSNFTKVVAIALASAFLPAMAAAAPVTGTLNITGGLRLTSTTAVDFTDPFTVGPGSTDGFAALLGTTGAILDLAHPVGAPISLLDFLTFVADPTLSFELTGIEPGVFGAADCAAAAAAAQTCTVPGSQFNFVNTSATASTLSFSLSGIVHKSGEVDSLFIAVVSAQFAQSFQSLLASLAGGGGTPITSDSATFTVTATPVPLPAGFPLMIAGLAALGLAQRRSPRSRTLSPSGS